MNAPARPPRLVTISGLPGSGTSTTAGIVAEGLGLAHVDGGAVFRQFASDRGVTLPELGAMARTDPAFDLELDRRLAARAREGGVVLESRLAGWIAVNEGLGGLRVWVACDDAVRAGRVAQRDSLSETEAAAANRARESSERHRYATYYGVDLDDLSIYDLVLDSATATPAELAERICAVA